MLIKKVFFFIFFMFTVLLTPLVTYAYGDVQVSAECAVVINADTKEILFDKNSYLKKSMASTTKIMTSLIAIESGRLSEKVKIEDKIHSDGSSIGLKEGYTLSLESLVYGMMLESGNDAAEVTAEFLALSEERFADLMNKKARSIGMNSTNFQTASGLDGEEHYSTAYDMALLGAYAVKNPVFRRICSSIEMRVQFIEPDFSMTFSNHNKLMKYCDGVFGIKTGFTKKSGRCLVTACERGGTTLVAVTLNAPNDWDDHEKLYDECFRELKTVRTDFEIPSTVRIYGSDKDRISIRPLTDYYDYSYFEQKNLTVETLINRIVHAPVKSGDVLGEIRILCDGETIHKTPVIAMENVESMPGKNEKKKSLIEKIVEKFT